MSEEQPEYVAYLLRMWRVREGEGTTWRASLERPRNGQRIAFASLEAAIDFLLDQTGLSQQDSHTPDPLDTPGKRP